MHNIHNSKYNNYLMVISQLLLAIALLSPVLVHGAFKLNYNGSEKTYKNKLAQSQSHHLLNKSRKDIHKLLETRYHEASSLYNHSYLEDFYDFLEKNKQDLSKQSGINLGLAYTVISQYAYNSERDKSFASGDIDIFGTWDLFRNNNLKTMLGFRLESRERFTSDAPTKIDDKFELYSSPGSDFSNESLAIYDLWVEQEIIKNKLKVRFGRLYMYDIMNGFAFDSQSFYYLNNSLSGEPGAVDPQHGLGFVASYFLTKNYYFLLGMSDINAIDTKSGFSTFFNDSEYLKAVEFGYRSHLNRHYHDNYHIYLWHSDSSDKKDTKSDMGMSIILQKVFNYNMIPFVKLSINKGQAAHFKNLATAGIVFNNLFGYDFQSLGLAGTYGESANDKRGKEFVGEIYYRLQLLPYLHITPDYQIIRSRSETNNFKTTNVLGLRIRVSA